jgi:hypothetical protein
MTASLVGTGFLCPNNPSNMYAFMHERLPKYAHKKFMPNIKIDITLRPTNQHLS